MNHGERQSRNSFERIFNEKRFPMNSKIALALLRSGASKISVGRYFRVDHSSITALIGRSKNRMESIKPWDEWTKEEKKKAREEQYIPYIQQSGKVSSKSMLPTTSKYKKPGYMPPPPSYLKEYLVHLDADGTPMRAERTYASYLKEYNEKTKGARQARMRYFKSKKRGILKQLKKENKDPHRSYNNYGFGRSRAKREGAKKVEPLSEEVIKEMMEERGLDKPINTCSSCGALLVPDLTSLNFVSGEWDGHGYKFDCQCNPGLRLSIG